MSKVICIAGESGSGKTTAMRNLDPKTTLYIDCDKKGLSWKGWREQYNAENQNYIKTDFTQVVQQTLQKIDKVEKWKHIKVVVIDTINGLTLMCLTAYVDAIKRLADAWNVTPVEVTEKIDSIIKRAKENS